MKSQKKLAVILPIVTVAVIAVIAVIAVVIAINAKPKPEPPLFRTVTGHLDAGIKISDRIIWMSDGKGDFIHTPEIVYIVAHEECRFYDSDGKQITLVDFEKGDYVSVKVEYDFEILLDGTFFMIATEVTKIG